MSPIQIALLLLAVAGVWAIVELALTLRKTRTVVDSLDKTVTDLNNTIAEAQPVVAKLDGAVQKLFNKVKAPAADADRKLAAAAAEAEQPTERVLIGEAEDEAADGADAAQKPAAKPAQYYTYTPAESSEEACDE